MSGMRKKFQRVSRMLTAAALALAMVLSMTGIKARAAVSYQADLAIRGTVKFSGASNKEAPRAEFRLTGTDGAPMPEAGRAILPMRVVPRKFRLSSLARDEGFFLLPDDVPDSAIFRRHIPTAAALFPWYNVSYIFAR